LEINLPRIAALKKKITLMLFVVVAFVLKVGSFLKKTWKWMKENPEILELKAKYENINQRLATLEANYKIISLRLALLEGAGGGGRAASTTTSPSSINSSYCRRKQAPLQSVRHLGSRGQTPTSEKGSSF